MAKRSGWLSIPLVVVRHEWPHSSGATDPEAIRSEIIVTWERWQDASLPLSSHSFFGVTAEYRPQVEADDPNIAAANWHHLRTSIVALFRHECWNGISSNPSAETMARLIGEASSEPTFPAQHTAKQLEAARKSAASVVQTAMALFLASLPNMLEGAVRAVATEHDAHDNSKKIENKLPESPDVLELCRHLNSKLASFGTMIECARDFCRKSKMSDKKAENLLRQAKRFRWLW